MTTPNFKRTKLACYVSYFTMSSVFSLPPLLFVTLREMYGISYTLLGTLVLVNFCTQLAIDLAFTFFSRHFNVKFLVRVMPLLTSAGLFLYALSPTLFQGHVYAGLLTGTLIFSVASGLSEVMLSPMIAAIPSKNPGKDMSLLHSLYAFGVFTVVMLSAAYFALFSTENWRYLTMFFALLPTVAAVLFMLSPIPDMTPAEQGPQAVKRTWRRTEGLGLCVACIFFGSCAENAMSNWISGFMETALQMDKALGDILGMAVFAILLGIARIAYAAYGKHIYRVLLIGMAGAAVCYLLIGFSDSVPVAFIACILTGLFTSMLWPGTLILMEENIHGAGIAAFALMASGGDLGASIAPQLLGLVTDQVSASHLATELGFRFGLTPDQVGMKVAMLTCAIFPLLGTIVLLFIRRHFKRGRIE